MNATVLESFGDVSLEAVLRTWAAEAVKLPPLERELARNNKIKVLHGLVASPARVWLWPLRSN